MNEGILGAIANPQLADVAGALQYRKSRMDEDEAKRKELRMNQLIAQAIPNMAEDSPLREIAQTDPQKFAMMAKVLNIPLNEGERFEQLRSRVGQLSALAESDPREAYQYAQRIQAENQRNGIQDTNLDKWLQTVDKDPITGFNALHVMNQSLNPVKADVITAKDKAEIALKEKELNWKMSQPAGGADNKPAANIEIYNEWKKIKASGDTEGAEAFARANRLMPEWGQDPENRGKIKSKEVGIASTNKLIDEFYSKIQPINVGISNYSRAIELLDKDGAKSGVIDNLIPSFTAATQELDNLKLRFGADILSSGIFGAQVSDRDVKNAFSMAAPPMDEKPLKAWLKDKKESQEKVRSIYEGAIKYLAKGNTVADLADLQAKERDKNGKNENKPTVSNW